MREPHVTLRKARGEFRFSQKIAPLRFGKGRFDKQRAEQRQELQQIASLFSVPPFASQQQQQQRRPRRPRRRRIHDELEPENEWPTSPRSLFAPPLLQPQAISHEPQITIRTRRLANRASHDPSAQLCLSHTHNDAQQQDHHSISSRIFCPDASPKGAPKKRLPFWLERNYCPGQLF